MRAGSGEGGSRRARARRGAGGEETARGGDGEDPHPGGHFPDLNGFKQKFRHIHNNFLEPPQHLQQKTY